jgi:hypothetical protein
MRTCAHCGTPIEGYRRQARYCGGPCRAAASRARSVKVADGASDGRHAESARNRTHGTAEVVEWAALPREEQEWIEGLLARHADLIDAG